MLLLVKLIGFLILGLGVTIAVLPQITQKIFAFFNEGKRIYIAGIVRVVAGLLLLFASPQSRHPAAATILGVLFLLSGGIIFVTDMDKLKAFMMQYSAFPPLGLRLLGLVAACFGLLMIAVL